MKSLTAAVAAVSIFASLTTPDAALAQAQGPYPAVNIGGYSFSCTNFQGRQVPIYFDRTIGDTAIARYFPDGRMFIAFNPDATQRLSAPALAFVFVHECMHHKFLTASESEVDCHAAAAVRQRGIITNYFQLSEALRPLANSPGSASGHLPGYARIALIEQCWR